MSGAPLPPKSYWPPLYLYLQAAAIALVVWYLSRHFYADDAFISLRYARNLLDGQGMVWQPGERVEGYTNFLFVILTAALGALDLDLVWASRIISFAAFFALLAVVAWHVRILPLKRYAALPYREKVSGALTLSLVGSALPLLIWSLGGLETNLFAFFIGAAVCFTLPFLEHPSSKKAALIGLLFALATLTRPEGVIFFAFTLAFAAGLAWWRGGIGFRPFAAMLLAYAVIFLPYTLWRVTYFGEWLPNTYYVKVYGIAYDLKLTTGFFYLFQYIFMPPLLPLFAGGLAAFLLIKRQWSVAIAYLALLSGLFLAYIVHVGGDFMTHFRFMAPVIPLLALLIYHCGRKLIDLGMEKRWRDICGALVFFSLFQLGLVKEDMPPTPGALFGLSLSEYVQSEWPAGSLIALNPAGALPYTAPQYRYIDMLGLLDKTIARRVISEWGNDFPMNMGHAKGDGAYVLSRQPDYIIFGYAWGASEPVFLSDLEISRSPDFRAHYKKVEAYITPPMELLPLLQSQAAESAGPILNGKNQLRFIYYQRKK